MCYLKTASKQTVVDMMLMAMNLLLAMSQVRLPLEFDCPEGAKADPLKEKLGSRSGMDT